MEQLETTEECTWPTYILKLVKTYQSECTGQVSQKLTQIIIVLHPSLDPTRIANKIKGLTKFLLIHSLHTQEPIQRTKIKIWPQKASQ